MYFLVCRETGLDCDFIIKGETSEEFLKNGADHAIQQHGMTSRFPFTNSPRIVISYSQLLVGRE
jgi:predicted small metal-binding protein